MLRAFSERVSLCSRRASAPRSLIGDARLAHYRAMSDRLGFNVVGFDPRGTTGVAARAHADYGGAFTLTAESLDSGTEAYETATHEIGHLMGLRDTYREDGQRVPADRNVMGVGGGLTATQRSFIAAAAWDSVRAGRPGVGRSQTPTDSTDDRPTGSHWGPQGSRVPGFRAEFDARRRDLDRSWMRTPPPAEKPW